MDAVLALENGTVYRGVAAGAQGVARGEVVFNTSMTGYQEVLTDPSYAGQIVTMTCPQIGNYGVAREDVESTGPKVAGFIMREESPVASNWRASGTLRDYLIANNVVAIADIDTRELTRLLRSAGVMRGIIATGEVDASGLVEQARRIPSMEGTDLVREVTCAEPYDWPPPSAEGATEVKGDLALAPHARSRRPLRVAAYDFGIKWNILRRLAAYGCQVRVVPASTSAKDVLASGVDGVFLSNGPGDPAAVDYAIENTRALTQADKPLFGICLGHQILGLALGARTYKLKFGHRGANHPVKFLETGKVEITSQNHGFVVDPDSLPADVKVTHVNLYDGTVEGLRVIDRPIYSVQYHPEASPGPHDADYLFQQFVEDMDRRR
ncbi:MAG: glutamine-hydrolyzing carbamoyl-phosphate synthase small subunit [Vicinamibacterales bacterium]|nr:glutamine-hydrolyzing carbamoyl-phosphate synthase small subunit [Vicinamibacterales bacterium]